MTSKIKVDNITDQGGNNMVVKCGSTITLGKSGDTVALASGASQTGFGRTGTVDWQTGSIKTTTFTAVSGQGFFVDTNGGAVIANLPAGSAGAIVSFQDYRNTFDTAALTVQPNGTEKINGGTGAIVLSTEGEGLTLVYIDGTIGWRSIQDNVFADTGSNYVTATGGTQSTFGDFRIHKFTGPGSFCVSAAGSPAGSNTVDYLIVAGGGGGGSTAGGGGGAGGLRLLTSQPIGAGAFPVTVGSGGAKGSPGNGAQGGTTTFKCNSSAGGGGGGGYSTPGNPGTAGGSGGGGSGANGSDTTGGAGNTPPVSPPQGTAGGAGDGTPQCQGGGGGGGGAGAVGSNFASAGNGGPGGNGTDVSPTFGPGFGDSNFFSGGGGGGAQSHPTYVAPTGGNGGGGTGGGAAAPYGGGSGTPGGNGTDNTGGGGGGNGNANCSPVAGNGGSGIVLIKYKFQN